MRPRPARARRDRAAVQSHHGRGRGARRPGDIILRGRTVTSGTLANLRGRTRSAVHAITVGEPDGLVDADAVADHHSEQRDARVDSRFTIDPDHLDAVIGRVERRSALMWVLLLGGTRAGTAAGVAALYDTPAKIRTYSEAVTSGSALVAINGKVEGIGSLGGVIQDEFGFKAAFLPPLLGISLVARATRREEESGRLELLLGGRIARHEPTLAALLVATATIAATGVLVRRRIGSLRRPDRRVGPLRALPGPAGLRLRGARGPAGAGHATCQVGLHLAPQTRRTGP